MFKLRRTMCETCIYGPNSPIDKSRLSQYRLHWRAQDTHQICHKEQVEGKDDTVCCRGFYDANPGVGNLRRISERMGWVDIVD